MMQPKTSRNRTQSAQNDDIYSVSRLNREARRLVESSLARIWVAGEISNLARPASGHIYFTLKDKNAQVRCAMFRAANRRVSSPPADGDQVLVQGKVSIYEARGDYQLIVEQMEAAGEGLLRKKFEELKAELSAAGMFDADHKQALPELPNTIGVVTSPSGAAIRDILNILRRRYPSAKIIIYPTRVQGAGSADEICAAINTAIEHQQCDVLIIARGGGSLEDLWSFNEESVARAIYDCPLPTVAGIGHEVDVTIADLVADVRAPTPSGAAELIAPDRDELQRLLQDTERRALLSIRRKLTTELQRCENLHGRLNRLHPGSVINQTRQRIDELNRRLRSSLQDYVATSQNRQTTLALRLQHSSPKARLQQLRERLQLQQQRLIQRMQRLLEKMNQQTAITDGRLNTISPLATLERGYAIIQSPSGAVIRTADGLVEGDEISARLAHGELTATVTAVKE
jgi:exodeoxyribonuclease VII large subunit